MNVPRVALASETVIPPDLLAMVGWGVLIASVLITAAWLAHLYR